MGAEGSEGLSWEGGITDQVRVICSTQRQLTGTLAEVKQDLVGTLDASVVKLHQAQQSMRAPMMSTYEIITCIAT